MMNIVIKKIICGLVVLASVVSCLDGGSYTSSYPLNADFEYESLNFRPDSTYYYSADYLGIGAMTGPDVCQTTSDPCGYGSSPGTKWRRRWTTCPRL